MKKNNTLCIKWFFHLCLSIEHLVHRHVYNMRYQEALLRNSVRDFNLLSEAFESVLIVHVQSYLPVGIFFLIHIVLDEMASNRDHFN